MLEPRRLSLQAIRWSAHQLVLRMSLDELEFSTVYWYPDINLRDLERRFGTALLERLFVHAALFEINKIGSLRPRSLSLGPYAHHHTDALEALWTTIFHKVWAQWRYENGLPEDLPPRFESRPHAAGSDPVARDRDAEELLLFCGGGKDSLVSMKLLERAGLPFSSFAYASSVYGPAQPQLSLIGGLLDRCAPVRRHQQIVLDDFFDAPVLQLYGEALGVRTITAAETPSSIFAALPVLLAGGYPHAVLGHEASANRGNLIWAATGEDVNHQWGKSEACERSIDTYIRENLLRDTGVFSLLMPIHDLVIFELLRQDADAIGATHSCNVQKPWCRRCPKCVYVWLNLAAHLPEAEVRAVFPDDLLELYDNHRFVHDMIGLGEHTPFECIGQIEESRLALALLAARGRLGPRGRALATRLPRLDMDTLLERFTAVGRARLPSAVAPLVLPQMEAAAERCRARVRSQLSPEGGGQGARSKEASP